MRASRHSSTGYTLADVFAEDMLFATLDPTMRSLVLPSGRTAILSDTVGFISELPHDLVAAFRATLEEVVAADIVLHVRDMCRPGHRGPAAGCRTTFSKTCCVDRQGEDDADGDTQDAGPDRDFEQDRSCYHPTTGML